MTSFELVFSLFGLVLGLSLAEVLGGFARAIKLRRHARRIGQEVTRLGWLTPALAVFLLLDIAGFWFIVWRAREAIPATPASLLLSLIVTGLYYLAASWVFPHEPPEGSDFDAHFQENKRSILLLVLLCNLIAHGVRVILVDPRELELGWWMLAAYFLLLLGAAFVRNRKVALSALGLLIALYLMEGVGTAFAPPPDVFSAPPLTHDSTKLEPIPGPAGSPIYREG